MMVDVVKGGVEVEVTWTFLSEHSVSVWSLKQGEESQVTGTHILSLYNLK